jgi:flagellar basal-body rod protein FlgC
MSLFNVFNIAGSSMSAQSLRLNVTASNMANANSISSSVGGTYRAREPVFAAMYNDASMNFDNEADAIGVQVRGIVQSKAPIRSEYQPGNPMADKDGYIHLPNVNMVEEMANMISASRGYQSSVEVANTAKQMLLRTLTLGQ